MLAKAGPNGDPIACKLLLLTFNFFEYKLFTQLIVLDNDCCISRSVGRTEINLVTSNEKNVPFKNFNNLKSWPLVILPSF